jgi:hypothetical protein
MENMRTRIEVLRQAKALAELKKEAIELLKEMGHGREK